MVLFIAVMTSAMSIPEVRIDRGTLTLNGVVSGAASILLNPLDATLVGLATSLPFARRGVWPMLGNAAIYATVLCLSSLVSAHFRSGMGVAFGPRVATLITLTASDVVLVATAISVRTGESGLGVIQRNVTPYFFLAFGYFCLSALLISYVLDGSGLGYILATIVCVLALALTDTIAGRRVRRVLESELSDADRHLLTPGSSIAPTARASRQRLTPPTTPSPSSATLLRARHQRSATHPIPSTSTSLSRARSEWPDPVLGAKRSSSPCTKRRRMSGSRPTRSSCVRS